MKIRRVHTRILVLLALFLTAYGSRCWAQETYQATEVVFAKVDGGLAITIKGNQSPTFTTYQLFDPLRLVVDIANATFADSLHLPIEVNQTPVLTMRGTLLTEKKPEIAKLELLLSADHPYTVRREGNDITIVFAAEAKGGATPGAGGGVVPEVKEPPSSPQGKVTTPSRLAKEAAGQAEIYDVRVNKEAKPLTVLLVADGPIQEFSKVVLPKGDGRPDRMYVDVPGLKAPALDRKLPVGSGGLAQIRIADRPEGARFVFDSSSDSLFAFTVTTAPEGILITIGEGGQAQSPKTSPDPVAQILATAGAHHAAGATGKEPAAAKVGGKDEFAAAGYNREQITVDFYKTNLHNVFRLMGEVGGYNIVVDESVSGVLTLSLREVPWDFLLDVILNLKGLQKVEKYNTIVISAKDKGFVWPEKVVDEKKEEPLVEAPGAEMGVAIDRQLNQPPVVMEAKMLMQRGNALAREGKFKEALEVYQNALDKWPDNAELAKRMAGMCLVDLGYHQAAVGYAKRALAINANDQEAALQAAVALANMRQPEARLYFEKAVSGPKPSRSALLSYAGFQEENDNYVGTLATLAKFSDLYGANLDTMIARARVLDKQEKPELALAEYQAILLSGYDLAPDLAQYIKGRIALAKTQGASLK